MGTISRRRIDNEDPNVGNIDVSKGRENKGSSENKEKKMDKEKRTKQNRRKANQYIQIKTSYLR